MDWIEIKITSKSGEVLEYLAEILSEIGIQSVEICDFADFDNVVQTHIPYWDFIDENEYDRRKKEQPHIKAYVSDNEFGMELCEMVVFAMAELKKTVLSPEDHFKGRADDENDIAILKRDDNVTLKLGVFSLKGKSADLKAEVPDGEYTNQIDGGRVTVKDGVLRCEGRPIVIVSDRVEKFE